jgi:hypothetical protein
VDVFEILGVDPDADTGELRNAYRKAAKVEHPDVGGDTGRFIRLQRAYRQAQAQRAAARPRSASTTWPLDRSSSRTASRPERQLLAEIAFRFELGRFGSSPRSFIEAVDAELYPGGGPVDLTDDAVEVIAILIRSRAEVPVVVAAIVATIDQARRPS